MNDTSGTKNWPKISISLLFLLLLFGEGAFSEDLLSAEERLEALRQSLLDEALTGEVEVVSSAFVDSTGQLHESAYITANKTVRGVRVSGYLKPEVSSSPAPVRSRQEAECLSSRYRRQLVVSVRPAGDPNTRVGSIYLGAVVHQARVNLLEALRNNPQIVTVESDEGVYKSEYDEILASVDKSVGSYELDLQIDLSSSDAGVIDKGIHRVAKAANSIWQYVPFFNVNRGSAANVAGGIGYKMEVTQVDRPGVIFSAIETSSFRSQPGPRRATALPNGLRAEIKAGAEEVLGGVLQNLLCEPERIVIRREQDGAFTLLAGQEAGISAGDEFIIVRSTIWERDALNIDDVAELALVRVDFAYPKEAAVSLIAGPNAPDAGSLIAIPF